MAVNSKNENAIPRIACSISLGYPLGEIRCSSNSLIELVACPRRRRSNEGRDETERRQSCSYKSAFRYYSVALIRVVGVRNPAELFPVSEHAESFLNKDGMVATLRILEVRQRSERSGGLAVGTTPGRRKQTFGRGVNEEERAKEETSRGLSRRRRGLLLREIHEP